MVLIFGRMLWLQEITLTNYRNYHHSEVQLSPEINCFTGINGSGKTNLMDAIYYLSFTKSYFNNLEQQNFRIGCDWFSIEGNYKRNEMDEKVRIAVQKGEKKSVKANNNEYKKFAYHIGNYPLVLITPNDIMLIHEGSEDRRKFLDGMISQLDKKYLLDLLSYNRIIEQRNRQLRMFAESSVFDPSLLETYNEQLVQFGTAIFEKRKAFLASFVPEFRTFYQSISSSDEVVNLEYESDLNGQDFATLLQQSEQQDMASCRTSKGIHKDELAFTLQNLALKKYASQGQQKSFIIALKLAFYAYLKKETGYKPLLLLDDMFEKLDEIRLQKLMEMISHHAFGQLFITDTHLDRLHQLFKPLSHSEIKYFSVENGIIHEI